MNHANKNSFDLDDECAVIRHRLLVQPMPDYEPCAVDFQFPIWIMLSALAMAFALLAWRLPILLQIGVVV
jgi:hypothetical protein